MTEADLRVVLLWRALEPRIAGTSSAMSGAVAGRATGDWAGAEAQRRLGERADALSWLAERARLALGRLAEQQPAWRPLVDRARAATLAPWGWLLCALAGLAGLAGGTLGESGYLNLLAPPLLGLLGWNLAVYVLLAVRSWHGGRSPQAPRGAALRGLPALLLRGRRDAVEWLRRRAIAGQAGTAPLRALAAFERDWWQATAPLQLARGAALMHGAAAVLALAMLASWYARGLVLDYRAAWDSTFLDAREVHGLLQALLGPAAALLQQALPDAATLGTLRRASGGGEGAARWIHLWALTVVGAVVLPRLALAAASAVRARRLASRLALPDADDLRRLCRDAAGQPVSVQVLPYSYRLDAARQAALQRLFGGLWGPQLALQLQPSLPMGAEDQLPTGLSLPLPAEVVVLFALTATPERESHAAFVRALAALRAAGDPPLQVMVDESGFRERLSGATFEQRLAERRAAWTAMLSAVGTAPRFVDLAAV